MGGGSLAIVEKKPPLGGEGCAGGVLFHLLDWHRRLARKRRLFSPRRLLPSAVRNSSLRRLAPPPPSPAAPQPLRHAPSAAAGPDGKAAAPPGVVARLMGLESWPAAPGAAPRPQKQRKVEATASAGEGDNEPAPVVVMLPPSRRAPAPGSPGHAPRSHHSADLPARSPRRSRFVHAAASRLLEPGARASSKASARLQAIAYACSSPQHRGHPGASQQSWGTLELDDFLSRSDSLSFERRSPPPPADSDQRYNAVSSRWQETDSINTMSSTAAAGSVTSGNHTIVVPTSDSYDALTGRGSSDVDAMHRDYRARTGGMGSYAGVRSSNAGAGARTGEQRLLRKRGALTRPDVPRSVGSGNFASSTRLIGNAANARELAPPSSRRAAHNSGSSSSRRVPHNSVPRRESMSSITPQRSTLRDVTDRNGSASTSRDTSSASGQRRRSRKKIDRCSAGSNREGRNTVAFASSSSARPLSRASSDGKVPEKRGLRGTRSDTGCTKTPVVDVKCLEAEPCAMSATSEKEEFRRLMKAKVNELGLSDRVEPSDDCSANLTVSVLQELISALTNDTNTSASQSSNYSNSSARLNNAETVYDSNDQSPDFRKRYQFQGDQGADSSATCTNDESNQPSPTSVLEACFSNDASSSGSPTEKIESTEFFVSTENKMEDLFNLESDIEDLAMSIDATKTAAHGGGSAEIPCVQSLAAHDFEFLESRLHGIGEAIGNAELLLDSSLFCGTPSSLSLHSFIVEMLETVEAVFCGGPGSSFGFKEENKCQRTNFLFDCIVESLDSKFRDFGKCGYKALLQMPLILSKDLLKREISEEIGSWSEISSDRAAEKELDQVVAARWDACRTEVFDVSVAIEDDILEALVGEFAFDQCCC